MARDKGTSGGKVLLVLFLVLMVCGGLFLAWREFGRGGILPGPDDLLDQYKDRIDTLEKNNTALAEENEELEREAAGMPAWMFWGIIVTVAILLVLFATAYGQLGGKNINREQAKRLATDILSQEFGWEAPFWVSGRSPAGTLYWIRRTVHTGQAVDGDIDSLWFLVQFSRDFPDGGDLEPGVNCVTVLIKSNDASRQIHPEPGMNARQAAAAHGIKLQRTPQPTEGGLLSLEKTAETARALRDIVGPED